ncbi:hypothetical protein MtrunA17_Chr3g0127681 [Medicago truncatula]|uniref:Transmembrane protein, putative n=1 Tax=Medicago truncatula TaxID=3880 RepID=G7J898_MEDTR|nr:transmembrane protein, putative [Medicago truncatula]RHN69704.1 hypothetical protein MtrunA17_Chr3g0127681 [Medicago truncatula]
MTTLFNASKLKSFFALLGILLLLMSSMMMVSAAQSNFKHGRKLFDDTPTYSPYPGGGGYP